MTATASYVATLGRLLMALIFLFSGLGEFLAPATTQGLIASAGPPVPLAAPQRLGGNLTAGGQK